MHIKKLTKTECVKIINHDFRQDVTYRNENIDLSKSEKNVIYKKCDYKDIDKYIDDNNIYVYGKNGKHKDKINYLCSVVVHYPKNCAMPENQFFETMNKVLTKKFGNCMGAVVHYDEDTPHLHFLFMPVVYDKKNNRKKLCAKEVVNREMLQSFHSDIENDLKKMGYDVKLQNGKEERGIPYIEDIEIYKKLKDLENKYLQLDTDFNDLYNMFNEYMDIIKSSSVYDLLLDDVKSQRLKELEKGLSQNKTFIDSVR